MLYRSARPIIAIVAPTLFIVLLWQFAAWGISAWRDVPFPTPGQTIDRLIALLNGQLLAEHTLYQHIADSLMRWLGAFSIAAVAGTIYGIMAVRWHWFAQLCAPLPQILLTVPGLAWIPLAILIFGIGEAATQFMICITAFAPIALATLKGIQQVDISFIRAAKMLGANNNTLFFKVMIPAALPALLSGLRIGLGNSWRVLVAAEMVVGSGSGLGFSIIEARWTLDYTAAFACIMVICGIGLICEYGFLRTLERCTLERWTMQERR